MTKPQPSDLASFRPEPSWTEAERLAALYRYQILDTAEEEDFADIARLAVQFCNAPVSLISFVDKDRQWFKAKAGTDIQETPLDVSFCSHSIREEEIMVVEDATKDMRFVNNALVTGDPHIRFYAGAVLKTPSGYPLGTICILDFKPRQITEQQEETLKILARQVMTLLELKHTIREKRKSEERLQFALDTSAIVGTWDWDVTQDKVYADARFCKLFGLNSEAARQGVPADEFDKAIFIEDRDRIKLAARRAVETAGDFAEEYRVINADGELRWVFARGHAYNDEHGKPERFPGAAVDITERKRYERKQAARVELNDRLRIIKRTAEVTVIAAEIIGHTLDGVRAGYGELNHDCSLITIDRDWTNGTVASIAGVHSFDAYSETFAKAIKSGEVVVIDDIREDTRFRDHSDRFEKIDVRALINVSLVEDGKPKALFYIHDNKPRHWREGEIELVTEMAIRSWAEVERVHAEEQMLAALQRAEAASIAKTEFLANMSHEIRTPMNAIIGLSNILASEKLTPRQTEFVRTLNMSAESLLTLINDLLDISKIEARTMDLEKINFDLHEMLQDIVDMMDVRAREKGLQLTLDAECIEGLSVIADPTRIRQVMVNLCGNAIKFTEKGGVHIKVNCFGSGYDGIQNIHLSVRDTGIGIAEDKLATIFEKFVQADTSINRKYGGTGLGLAITKTLVDLMGGEIKVDSIPEKGSSFTVILPLIMADGITERNDYKMSNEQAPDLRKRVLLVEDYAPNVLVAGTFLEEFGYEWDSAKSGNEAIEKITAQKFDAVLMDVQMFGMNGLEATQIIRKRESEQSLSRIPIIGMTAHALAGDREKCLDVGMDDYISKPFNPEDLQRKLKVVTES